GQNQRSVGRCCGVDPHSSRQQREREGDDQEREKDGAGAVHSSPLPPAGGVARLAERRARLVAAGWAAVSPCPPPAPPASGRGASSECLTDASARTARMIVGPPQ